jgi:hypothetical protein
MEPDWPKEEWELAQEQVFYDPGAIELRCVVNEAMRLLEHAEPRIIGGTAKGQDILKLPKWYERRKRLVELVEKITF